MDIKHNVNHPLAKRVEAIMEYDGLSYSYDYGRIAWVGGYPSDWMILGDLVIIATLGGSDWNEPELIVQPIDEFVKEEEERVADIKAEEAPDEQE